MLWAVYVLSLKLLFEVQLSKKYNAPLFKMFMMADWLRRVCCMGMKCTAHDLEFMGLNPTMLKLICVVLLCKSYLNKKYQFPVQQSI